MDLAEPPEDRAPAAKAISTAGIAAHRKALPSRVPRDVPPSPAESTARPAARVPDEPDPDPADREGPPPDPDREREGEE
jgi:hypothetical protein